MKIPSKLLFETISVIAVVFSLLFVAFQIRQSNDIAISTNENDVRANFSALNEAIMLNPELAELLYRSEDPEFIAEGRDRVILMSYIARNMNAWRTAVNSYEIGLLSQLSYDAVFDDIRFFIEQRPGLDSLLRDFLGKYPSRFNDPIFSYINELLVD